MRTPIGVKLLLSLTILVSCASPLPTPDSGSRQPAVSPGGPIEAVLVQINDVYEIAGMQKGKSGGLARVASLKKKLLSRNKNTYMVLAGDFVSPTALNTAIVDGKPLRGRPMVSSLAMAGLDLAVFGNHEFDLPKPDLDERISEARGKFLWLSGNIREANGKPYGRLPETHVQVFRDEMGRELKVGFITTTITMAESDYVKYADPIPYAVAQARALRPHVDALVAVTHLSLAEDQQLAKAAPEIDLIAGGHEHEKVFWKSPSGRGPAVAKADANARSAYAHVLRFSPQTRRLAIESTLIPLDEKVPEDPQTKAHVEKWLQAAFNGFRAAGFQAARVIGRTKEPLDGRESLIRTQKTNLTQHIGRALLRESKGADIALFIGGSVRIDDIIPPGPITEYDVIRIFPYSEKLRVIPMNGAAVKKALLRGKSFYGKGDFLQAIGVEEANGRILINDTPLDEKRVYRIATNGYFANTLMSFSDSDIDVGRDIRRVFIDYIRAEMP